MEWRHEAVRWFDHWLKGKDTGIMDEPDFAVYVRDWLSARPGNRKYVPGRWRWEDGWPIERGRKQEWYAHGRPWPVNANRRTATHNWRTRRRSVSKEVGRRCGGAVSRQTSNPWMTHSLVYDSEPLQEPMEILGWPVARLNVSADATRANWVVRISDVAPDGQVTQVAARASMARTAIRRASLKTSCRERNFRWRFELHFTSWVFPKGHSVRVAVSNSMADVMADTMPFATTLAIGGDEGARMQLPVVPPEKKAQPGFRSPEPSPQLPGFETLDSGNITGYAAITEIHLDPETGEAFGVARNSGATKYPWGIERFEEKIEHRTSDSNPAHTSVMGRYANSGTCRPHQVRTDG